MYVFVYLCNMSVLMHLIGGSTLQCGDVLQFFFVTAQVACSERMRFLADDLTMNEI